METNILPTLPVNLPHPQHVKAYRPTILLLLLYLFYATPATAQNKVPISIAAVSGLEDEEQFFALYGSPGKLFFVVDDSGYNNGFALWQTNVSGTSATYVKTFQLIVSFARLNGSLLLIANDGVSGNELWKTDGTPEGTMLVKDIHAGAEGSGVNRMIVVGNTVYFAANDGTRGRELWKSDGTTSGTMIVKDIMRVIGSSDPNYLLNVNGRLFFTANDGIHGYELWKSDGTVAGTTLVRDIRPGSKLSSSPTNLANVNGLLMFSAFDPATGRELYRSNGSSAGTVRVKDIKPGTQSSNCTDFVPVDSTLFFTADDGIHGLELWKSNGTAAGTRLVKDVTPGPGSDPSYLSHHLTDLTGINHHLYFLGSSVEPGMHLASQSLWVSDGTEAGTFRLTDFDQMSFSFIYSYLTEYKGMAYFIGSDLNLEMWKTDGTPDGEVRVFADIGTGYHTFTKLTRAGNYLYFIAYGNLKRSDGTEAGTINVTGIEHTMPPDKFSASNEAATVLPEKEGDSFSFYPSPFQTEFSLQVEGARQAGYQVKIMNANGILVENHLLDQNHIYNYGASWPSGLYLLHLQTQNGWMVKRIYKK